MRALEDRVIANGTSAERLMEEVGALMGRAVLARHPQPGLCVVYAGKGNNAGDGFVVARELEAAGWRVFVRLAYPPGELGPLAAQKFRELEPVTVLAASEPLPCRPGEPLVLLDALLGLGAQGQLREPVLGLCREINALRRSHHARVYALDLPTGLDGLTGAADPDAVRADCTLTVAHTKTGLVADAALDCVGRLAVIPVRELSAGLADVPGAREDSVLTADWLRAWLTRRDFGSHKGDFGRIAVIAGSRGMLGAAKLCASGALRGGAGFVRVYTQDDIYAILAGVCPPEVMVKPVESILDVLDDNQDVIAIGPGLGTNLREPVLELIRRWDKPMIIDADALNILAQDMTALESCAGPRLLTPHPGEMGRLMPGHPQDRAEAARAFVERYAGTAHPVTLLFKGSRTIIAEAGQPLLYNTTGTSGMSTGGMGDVLAGVAAALAGSNGVKLREAAAVAAWACGRASELAVTAGSESEQSMLPEDTLRWLGRAFRELETGGL